MDPLTHAAFGLAICEAGPRKRIGPAAIGLAIAASVLPDGDAAIGLISPWALMQYHRTLTHSVGFVPIMAVVLAFAWKRFSSCKDFRLLCLFGLVLGYAHLLLDLPTSYGTEFLWPISYHRFALDWVAVVDPVVTVVLIVGVIGAWRAGRRGHARGERVAAAGLIVAIAYICFGGVQHARAMQVLGRQTAGLGEPIARAVIPQVPTTFVWRLVHRGAATFWIARYNSFTGRITSQRSLVVQEDRRLRTPPGAGQVSRFEQFARRMTWTHPGEDRYDCIVVEDMRYAWPTGSLQCIWSLRLTYAADAAGGDPRLQRIEFIQRHPPVFRIGKPVEKVYTVFEVGD